MPPYARDLSRRKFTNAVAELSPKIQIGARGLKNGPDWIAVDLYDKSELIDHNWSIHNLPLEDESVGCFVCNAVLEHVNEPQLAIFEMYRTLKVGGQIWVEVPFNQFYHAHPSDFRRWTLPGLQWEMRRFDDVSSGISGELKSEVQKIANSFVTEGKLQLSKEHIDQVARVAEMYVENVKLPRLYSGVYFWGAKRTHVISLVEREYMSEIRAQIPT